MTNNQQLAQALRDILEATKACDDAELTHLWAKGLLPTGVLTFVRACRVKLNG